MFWLHHPQPVRPRKAVAELTVSRYAASPMNTSLIIVDGAVGRVRASSAGSGETVKPAADRDPQG